MMDGSVVVGSTRGFVKLSIDPSIIYRNSSIEKGVLFTVRKDSLKATTSSITITAVLRMKGEIHPRLSVILHSKVLKES